MIAYRNTNKNGNKMQGDYKFKNNKKQNIFCKSISRSVNRTKFTNSKKTNFYKLLNIADSTFFFVITIKLTIK